MCSAIFGLNLKGFACETSISDNSVDIITHGLRLALLHQLVAPLFVFLFFLILLSNGRNGHEGNNNHIQGAGIGCLGKTSTVCGNTIEKIVNEWGQKLHRC